jgi:hypothetical protein
MMDGITIPDPLKRQFVVAGPTTLFDESGHALGLFLPQARRLSPDELWTREELDASYKERGGVPLDEIWRSLGVK